MRRGRRAHPRGCGADRDIASQEFAVSGLIPAGAGQTPGDSRPSWTPRAHPRGCGADSGRCSRLIQVDGSSPRVRGRRAGGVATVGAAGLIPAGAGQTISPPPRRRCFGAHPRGCGADSFDTMSGVAACGSSPRVRGRHSEDTAVHDDVRLIPAGAGQTNETFFSAVSNAWLIPAGAGQTTGIWRGCGLRTAHPRGCGADVWVPVNAEMKGGLIPAGAGQTSRHHPSGGPRPAHPRGCGADPSRRIHSGRRRGSSPRVRGRPGGRQASSCPPGLIPAGAGQTNRG